MDLGIKTKKIQPPNYGELRKDSHCWDRNEAFERAQNLIISGVVRNLIGLLVVVSGRYHWKANQDTYTIDIADDCGDTRQSGTTTWHNADVLVCIQTALSLTVCVVVQVCDRFSKCFDGNWLGHVAGNRIRRTFDTSCRGVFQRIDGHGY